MFLNHHNKARMKCDSISFESSAWRVLFCSKISQFHIDLKKVQRMVCLKSPPDHGLFDFSGRIISNIENCEKLRISWTLLDRHNFTTHRYNDNVPIKTKQTFVDLGEEVKSCLSFHACGCLTVTVWIKFIHSIYIWFPSRLATTGSY